MRELEAERVLFKKRKQNDDRLTMWEGHRAEEASWRDSSSPKGSSHTMREEPWVWERDESRHKLPPRKWTQDNTHRERGNDKAILENI